MAETAKTNKSIFDRMNSVDVSKKTEKKNGLTYLSWAWAWGEVKKICPEAQYKVYETESGCIYHTDGKTCWVKVSVTIGDLEHIEYLPVMDYRNISIPLERVTSMDVNKAIQRAITKACARHGLGLYIYAGEDLPEEITEQTENAPKTAKKPQKKAPANVCSVCGKEITAYGQYTAEVVLQESTKKLGKPTCMPCWQKQYADAKKKEADANAK